MMSVLYSLGYLIVGHILIFSGLAFTNKLFFPSLLQGIYDQTTFPVRVLMFTFIFALPANFFIPKAFQVTSHSIAGPMLLGVILIIVVVNAMIVDRVQLTLPVLAAGAAALFFCCLTAWLLEGQRALG
jgi:hypothetical protein